MTVSEALPIFQNGVHFFIRRRPRLETKFKKKTSLSTEKQMKPRANPQTEFKCR